jgi:LmbE family N-acetylglucosaminyl deacetylase
MRSTRWFIGGALAASVVFILMGSNRPAPEPAPAAAVPPPAAELPPAFAKATAGRPASPEATAGKQDGKLRIIVFGAHPDDAEFDAGGVAAKWAAQGHHVKFVSCTNGDIGHWKIAGGPLAMRRTAEVKKCAQILGITTEVLDIHDGELMVTMENRRTICRLIREWKADIVISHRPNDYHPDHRYTGVLVMDAAYMVTVPFFCPDTPHLTKNPVFLFAEDHFRKPNPFSGDIVVSIDDVIDKKLACVEALESQVYEGGCNGGPHLIPDPKNADAVARRKEEIRGQHARRAAGTAERFRENLKRYYGDAAAQVQHAEAFEICEYGRRPDAQEIRKLFPFFPAQ